MDSSFESDAYMIDDDDASEDSFMMQEEENVAPPAKASKKAAAAAPRKKKAAAAPKKAKVTLDNDDSDDDDDAEVLGDVQNSAVAAKRKGSNKTVEETYQKKSQLEHILLRPDTYVGSTTPQTQPMYILDGEHRVVERNVTYTPGLYKIFDEIIVNAADNKQRDPNGMDQIHVSIDAAHNLITVRNNGQGIPVVMHKEHKCYVPELIFGHLLTGSNFDDDERKTTGGRNGFGAKLANVFSRLFTIECVDSERKLHYHQVFEQNMSVKNKPTVKKCTAAQCKKGDYVQISFQPDLQRFGMESLDNDTVALLGKRAYDIAATMGFAPGKALKVHLDNTRLPVKSFKDYLKLYSNTSSPIVWEMTDRWEVSVGVSPDASMKQISFVNSICTSNGGTHVKYLADQICKHLAKVLTKRKKSPVSAAAIKNHITIFCNCLIENPSFSSQTKEEMTLKSKDFGSTCKLSDSFLKKLEKSEIADMVLAYTNFKERQQLKTKSGKKKGKLTGIAKLDDANHAGGRHSADCTLIITEGDSAKSLAMAGLSVIGRDHYGVFPLRGKPLNVRDATLKAVTNNEEIKNLVEILGLKFQTVYDESNIKSLRYGHLLIMADQDTDGSHIKGLIVNLIHHFWPSLLDVPGFLQQFITPIVKVTKKGKKKSTSFFNLPEYQRWLESNNQGQGYNIKYYKGLGTSTSAEAKEYFSDLDLHQINFGLLCKDLLPDNKNDGDEMNDDDLEFQNALPDSVKSGSNLIEMVFSKSRVEDRKQWLTTCNKDTFLDYTQIDADGVRYSEFINKEYILFSQADNERSIPNLIDGFKPSQRKVLFGCFKRKLKGEIKVAQLTGYVAEHSAYHHGEVSLQQTIVNMAQNYTGSNNVNLLTPSGQFGTRRMGGKDAASARYIFTKLEPITRTIFHPDDDELLTYLQDDGSNVEPEFYVPVIPMVLVNGAEGIGTGWSTNVQNYNPRDVITNIKRMIAGEEPEEMKPYFHGFSGEITPATGKRGQQRSFDQKGIIERVNDTTVRITELPVRTWTQTYKEWLESMITGDGKEKIPILKEFSENHTETTVDFTVVADKEKMDEFEQFKGGLLAKFKLTGSMATSNMTLFDQYGKLSQYSTTTEILKYFYTLRLDFYGKRKAMLVDKLEMEQRKLSNKARFVEEVCSGDLVVSNRKRTVILADLQERNYELFDGSKKKDNQGDSSDSEDEVDESPSDAELAKGYEYLLGMKIWSLTLEKAQELRHKLEEKTAELKVLQAMEPTEIWLNDLEQVEIALDDRDADLEQAAVAERKSQQKSKKRQAKKKAGKKKKKKDEWDESDEDESEIDDSGSDEESGYKPKKRAPVARKPTARKAPAAKPAPKPAPAMKMAVAKPVAVAKKQPKPAPAVAKKPATPQKADSDSSDSDDYFGASLASRMQKKVYVSPKGKKLAKAGAAKSKPSNKAITLDFSSEEGSSLESFTATSYDKAKLTPAVNKKAAKKTKVIESDSEDDMEFPSEDEAPVKPAATKRSGRATKKTVYADSASVEDFEESDSDF